MVKVLQWQKGGSSQDEYHYEALILGSHKKIISHYAPGRRDFCSLTFGDETLEYDSSSSGDIFFRHYEGDKEFCTNIIEV